MICKHSLRIQVCPKKGINPTILLWGQDWDHQSYSREGSGFLGISINTYTPCNGVCAMINGSLCLSKRRGNPTWKPQVEYIRTIIIPSRAKMLLKQISITFECTYVVYNIIYIYNILYNFLFISLIISLDTT